MKEHRLGQAQGEAEAGVARAEGCFQNPKSKGVVPQYSSWLVGLFALENSQHTEETDHMYLYVELRTTPLVQLSTHQNLKLQ